MGTLAITSYFTLRYRQYWRMLPVFMVGCLASSLTWGMTPDSFSAPLRAKYVQLEPQLLNNQFKRELTLDSIESSHDLKGDIYAAIDYPFAKVNLALNNPVHWCDVLILHINVKYCQASLNNNGAVLAVDLGKKLEQPLADAYRVNFNYREVITTQDYFAVELKAETGPLGTHDYRIWIEATPLANGRTFLHFSYSYAFGLSGRLAMQAYLGTIGRDKVGFTITGNLQNGRPNYIQGVRGVVERNTMRYYLAIDAYLAALTTRADAQLEQRLQNWYSGTNQYAIQLHEVERDDYLSMKRNEYERQQAIH